MTIAVRCPECGEVHQVGPEMRGKRAKCRCGNILSVPAAEQASATQRPAASRKAPQSAGSPAAAPGLRVRCPGCGRIHQANASMAGTSARCECGTVMRIPGQQQATSPGATASPPPASGVASLLDELTEKDHKRFQKPVVDPEADEGPTQDDILQRYVTTMPKVSSRKHNVKRPIGAIVLGVLEVMGGLLVLLASVVMLLVVFGALASDRFFPGADPASMEKLKIVSGFMFGMLLLSGILYIVGAIGLFMGRPFGWWINACLMMFEPVALLGSFVITLTVATFAEKVGAAAPGFFAPDAKTFVRVAISVGILVYLAQQGVMDYYEIEKNRWVALGIAFAVALVVFCGTIGIGAILQATVVKA